MSNSKTLRLKRIVIALLSTCLVLGFVSVIAITTAPQAKAVNVGDWTALSNALSSGQEAVLTGNITAGSSVTVGNGAILNMNGFNITYSSGSDNQIGDHWSVRPTTVPAWIAYLDNSGVSGARLPEFFVVSSGRTFTITGGGTISYSIVKSTSGTNRADWVCSGRIVKNSGTLIINGTNLSVNASQKATGGYAHCAASLAVPVQNNGGIVNIYGGTIEATTNTQGRTYRSINSGRRGGAYSDGISVPIYSASGTVNMYGGKLVCESLVDDETDTGGVGTYDGQWPSLFGYSVGVDLQGSGAFNMYGGAIENNGSFLWNDVGALDGYHFSIATGVNYTGSNYPKIVGGQITTAFLTQGAMYKGGGGTPYAVRGAVGSTSVSLSPNGGNTGTFNNQTTTYWRNEFARTYNANPGTGQYANSFSNMYGGMVNGSKVRVIYRLYNSSGTRVATSEYHTGYVTKVLSAVPSLTGITRNGNTTSASAGGEFYYNSACGTGSASYVNPFYADASSLTIRYLKQAASASYPDLNSMSGLSTGSNTTVGSSEMIYIFVDVQLRPTFTAQLQPAGSTVQYQGEAIIPGTDFVVNFSSNPTGLTLNDFNWNKNVTGKRQDIVWSYTGTSSGSGLPELPGTYTVTGSIADTQPNTNWANYPGENGVNVYATSANCEITINKRTPVINASNPTLTYGQALSSVGGYTISSNTRVPQSIAGTWHWENLEGTNITNTVLGAGTYTVKLVWTPNSTWANRYNSTFKQLTLTVNKAPLTIAAKNFSHTYGDAKQFSETDFNWTGIVGSDTPASLFEFIKSNCRINGPSGIVLTANQNGFIGVDAMKNLVVNAGGYSWGLSNQMLANYNITASDGTITILKREITCTATAVDKVYDGNPNVTVKFVDFVNCVDAAPSAEGVMVDDVIGAAAQSSVGTNIHVTFTDAYGNPGKVILTGAKAGNYNCTVSNVNTLSVNITKKAPTLVVPTVPSAVYDHSKTVNTHFSANPTNNILTTDNGSGTPGYWSWATPDAIPVVGTNNYNLVFTPNDTTNYENGTGVVAVTITKRPITISIEQLNPISYGDNIPGFRYTFAGFTDNEKLEWNTTTNSLDGLDIINGTGDVAYQCGYSAGDDAGDYVVSVTNTLDAPNYSFNNGQGTLTVDKVQLTVIAENKTCVYGATAPTFTAKITSGFVGDDNVNVISGWSALPFNCSYVPGNANGSVGTYAITPVVASLSATNYSFIAQNGTLTVTKAPLTIRADNKTINYNAPVPAFTYTCVGLVGGDTASTALNVIQPAGFSTDYTQGDDAGTYSIYLDNDPEWVTSNNYNLSFEGGTLTVNTIQTQLIRAPLASLVYEDALADAVFDFTNAEVWAEGVNIATQGTWTFANASTVPSYQDGGQTLYDLIFTPNNPNYSVVSTQITVTITKRPISGIPAIAGSVMEGETVTADVSGMNPSGIGRYVFAWYLLDAPEDAGNLVGSDIYYAISMGQAGKYLKLVVTADPDVPYIGSAFTISEPISPPLPAPTANDFNITFENGSTTKVYDGQPFVANVTVKDGIVGMGEPSLRFNNSPTAPTKAGTYRLTLDVTAGTAYGPITGLHVGDITIEKRELQVSFAVLDKVYDGKTIATRDGDFATISNNVEGDDVAVNIQAASFRFVDANVGVDKAVTMTGAIMTGLDKGNYYITVDDSVTATITPKNITTKARTVARYYDPDDYSVTCSFTSLSGVLTADRDHVQIASYAASVTNNNAGTRPVTSISAVLGGAKSGNYVLTITNANDLSVVINKTSSTEEEGFEIPVLDEVAYNAQRLSDIGLPPGWAWTSPTTKIAVNNSGYQAIYTPVDTANYNTYTVTLPLTVTKRTVTVKFDSHEVIYGAPVPTLSYTITGFAQGESAANFGGSIFTSCNYIRYSGVGSYYVTNSSSSTFYNTNYNVVYEAGTITVTSKTIEVSATATDRIYRAGIDTVDIVFTLNNAQKARPNDDVYLTFSYGTGTMANANAGNNKSVAFVAPTLDGSSAGNYTLVYLNPSLTVNIAKAIPTGYSFPGAATIDYGQRLSEAVFTVPGTGAGTFKFANGDTTPVAVGYFPSSYEVVFTPTDTNYQTVTRKVPLTVNAAKLSPTVTISGTMYVGETLTANVTGVTGAQNYLHYKWYRVTSAGVEIEIGTDSPSYMLTSNEVDCYIKVVITIDANAPYYFDELIGTVEFTGDKAVIEEFLTFWQKIIRWWNSIMMAIKRLISGVGR